MEKHLEQQDLAPILSRFPRERTYLLPALLAVQKELGFLPNWAIGEIAIHLRLTANDADGVATSYPEIRRQPSGRHVLRVCTGPACFARGGDRVLAALSERLGISVGETTSDGSLTLEETTCAFVCAQAPVMDIDDRTLGQISPEKASRLAEEAKE